MSLDGRGLALVRDVAFGEDDHLARSGHIATNLAAWDVLEAQRPKAQRRERACVRREKGHRWADPRTRPPLDPVSFPGQRHTV
jgi:hypothetical protein